MCVCVRACVRVCVCARENMACPTHLEQVKRVLFLLIKFSHWLCLFQSKADCIVDMNVIDPVCRLNREEDFGSIVLLNVLGYRLSGISCSRPSDIRDKLRPMPKHGSILHYVHGNHKVR